VFGKDMRNIGQCVVKLVHMGVTLLQTLIDIVCHFSAHGLFRGTGKECYECQQQAHDSEHDQFSQATVHEHAKQTFMSAEVSAIGRIIHYYI
jgi:hypothetical protein